MPLIRNGQEEYILVSAKGRFSCEESEISPSIRNMEKKKILQRLPNK